MNREKFIKIVQEAREDTQEPCNFEISSFHACCDCNESPTIYFDETTEEATYEFIYSHAAHSNARS